MKIICALGAIAIVASGCANGPERMASVSYLARAEYQNRPKAAESLFGTDEAVLRGANIEQILSSKIVIPPKARLAILRFGERRPWQWWSEEFAKLDQDLESGIVVRLQNSKRLSDVSLLPSMMAPERESIPYLREAAARYQADLLLVYRSESRTFEKSRFLKPDEVKARCVVEAILLDTRTGIVPFSSISAQEFVEKKSKEDYGFAETIAKAEMRAISTGLEKVGEEMAKFLEVLP